MRYRQVLSTLPPGARVFGFWFAGFLRLLASVVFSATLGPPGEARLEPSQKSKNFGLYLASPPRPELGSWKSTVPLGYSTTAKAHYSDRSSCGRKSKIFRFWGRAPRGLFTASSDRLGRDILTFWSESEFERSQKKPQKPFPRVTFMWQCASRVA